MLGRPLPAPGRSPLAASEQSRAVGLLPFAFAGRPDTRSVLPARGAPWAADVSGEHEGCCYAPRRGLTLEITRRAQPELEMRSR